MNDDKWLEHVKTALNQSTEDMDAGTRSRLRQARQKALDAAPPVHSTRWAWWLPAGGTAFAALLTVFLISAQGPEAENPELLAHLDDIELLASTVQTELYENLDFYQWLTEMDDANG